MCRVTYCDCLLRQFQRSYLLDSNRFSQILVWFAQNIDYITKRCVVLNNNEKQTAIVITCQSSFWHLLLNEVLKWTISIENTSIVCNYTSFERWFIPERTCSVNARAISLWSAEIAEEKRNTTNKRKCILSSIQKILEDMLRLSNNKRLKNITNYIMYMLHLNDFHIALQQKARHTITYCFLSVEPSIMGM